MTWRTHVAVGMNALWLVPVFQPLDQSIIILLPVVILASILPDLDATSAKIHYIGGGVLGIFKGAFYGKYFHHRGIMHSLLVALILFILLWAIFRNSIPSLPYVFAVSYISHSLIDGFNSSVGFLYPFIYKRYAFLPQGHRARVGGLLDKLFLLTALFGILMFFFVFRLEFMPNNFTF